jgi:hypothetical protein
LIFQNFNISCNIYKVHVNRSTSLRLQRMAPSNTVTVYFKIIFVLVLVFWWKIYSTLICSYALVKTIFVAFSFCYIITEVYNVCFVGRDSAGPYRLWGPLIESRSRRYFALPLVYFNYFLKMFALSHISENKMVDRRNNHWYFSVQVQHRFFSLQPSS